MNSDIRIAVSFKDHRKRKRLRMILGDRATDYLLDLWISTALNHPDGFLTGMDTFDIALDAGYEGNPDVFVKAFVDCGLIEYVSEKSCYYVHDWDKHQAYAVHAEARSAKAANAAKARWGARGAADASPESPAPLGGNAPSMLQASKTDAPSIAPSITDASIVEGEAAAESPAPLGGNAPSMLQASKSNAPSIAPSITDASIVEGEAAAESPAPLGGNAPSMLQASKTDAWSIPFYAPSNAPSPTPSPNPNPEIQKDIEPPKRILNTKIARAREVQEGEDPDFRILRDFWNANCRLEGRLTGVAEFKKLKMTGKWPGIEVIVQDIKEKINARVWKPTYAPSLRTYLGEEWYAVSNTLCARSRDSPARQGSVTGVTESNFAVAQQVLSKLGGLENG